MTGLCAAICFQTHYGRFMPPQKTAAWRERALRKAGLEGGCLAFPLPGENEGATGCARSLLPAVAATYPLGIS